MAGLTAGLQKETPEKKPELYSLRGIMARPLRGSRSRTPEGESWRNSRGGLLGLNGNAPELRIKWKFSGIGKIQSFKKKKNGGKTNFGGKVLRKKENFWEKKAKIGEFKEMFEIEIKILGVGWELWGKNT